MITSPISEKKVFDFLPEGGSSEDNGISSSPAVVQVADSAFSSQGRGDETVKFTLKERVRHIFQVAGQTLKIVWMAISTLISYIACRFAAGAEDLARTLFFCKKRHTCDGMVSTDHFVEKSRERFELNKGVMSDIAARYVEEKSRRQAEFLAANFMGKVAPTQMHLLNKAIPGIEQQFQVGSHSQYHYHRYGFVDNPEIGQKVNKKTFSLAKDSPFIPTDTVAFTQLYPLYFEPVHNLSFPIDYLGGHFVQHQINPLSIKLDKPLIFDLTDRLGHLMGKANENEARTELKQVKAEAAKELDQAAKELFGRFPEYSKSRIKNWLKTSSVFICRVQDKESPLCGIKALPIFQKMTGGKYVKAYPSLVEFISNTGLFIGAVNLRRYLWSEPLNPKESRLRANCKGEYSAHPTYFETKVNILNCSGFMRCEKTFADKTKPHFHALGMGMIALLKGLLNDVTDKQWENLCSDEFMNEVFQVSIYSILHELSNARVDMINNEFDEFSQKIEIAHAYLANLLEVMQPYNEKDYVNRYREILGNIPGVNQAHINPGLCKTGMNAFTAITAAISKSTDQPVRAYGKGFYFEQAGMLGYDNSLEAILEDDSIEQVDLYACQFFPNVEIDSNFTHYEKGKIEDDIRLILQKKQKTEHLTVAVDCTIDYINSVSMKGLLKEFKDEITGGKLNFVFFRSGQKLDQFGMDTYYGAPFVQINNGASHWEPFKNISEEKAFRTDPLSLQWFTLAFTYATPYLERYRELIFENARKIVHSVPERLKPSEDITGQSVRVNTFSDDMLPSFIDIKITGLLHGARAKWLLARFYDKFNRAGHAINTRASFGFIQPNFVIIQINEVPNASTIRLNPGINPEQNALIVQLLSEMQSRD